MSAHEIFMSVINDSSNVKSDKKSEKVTNLNQIRLYVITKKINICLEGAHNNSTRIVINERLNNAINILIPVEILPAPLKARVVGYDDNLPYQGK